jgi:hypothetical protein
MSRGAAPTSDRLLAAGVFVVFATVFVLARQASLYGQDVTHILADLHAGRFTSDRHLLFRPVAAAWNDALAWTGSLTHTRLQLLSAAGTAAGLAWSWLASRRLGASRPMAALHVLLLGCTASIVHYATIVEHHGIAFAGIGLAWWAFAALWNEPTFGRALAYAAATAFAAGLHSLTHLLALVGCAWLLVAKRARWPLLAAVVGAHAAFVLPLLLLRETPATVPEWERLARSTAIDLLPRPSIAWREWLLPYFVVSLAPFVALLGRRPVTGFAATRTEAWWFAALGAAWTVMVRVLIPETDERGAYYAPLAFPAAWLAAHALPRRGFVGRLVCCAAVAATTIVAILCWSRPDRAPWDPAVGDGIAALARERPSLLVLGTCSERDAVSVLHPEVAVRTLDDFAWALERQGIADRAAVAALFETLLDTASENGGRLVFAASTADAFAASSSEALQWLGREHLRRFHHEPVAAGGFRGVVITRARAR